MVGRKSQGEGKNSIGNAEAKNVYVRAMDMN